MFAQLIADVVSLLSQCYLHLQHKLISENDTYTVCMILHVACWTGEWNLASACSSNRFICDTHMCEWTILPEVQQLDDYKNIVKYVSLTTRVLRPLDFPGNPRKLGPWSQGKGLPPLEKEGSRRRLGASLQLPRWQQGLELAAALSGRRQSHASAAAGQLVLLPTKRGSQVWAEHLLRPGRGSSDHAHLLILSACSLRSHGQAVSERMRRCMWSKEPPPGWSRCSAQT